MKKIGLIGGTGPESTLVYYKELNKRVNEKYNGEAFPEIVLESVDLWKVLGLVGAQKYDELGNYMNGCFDNLQNSGAEIVALTSATMHVVSDRFNTKVPFISIPETVAEYAANRGYKKVGLLGTIFTMENDYLSGAFWDRGIEVVIPQKTDRDVVNDRISNELEYGMVKEKSQSELIRIIEKMRDQDGIEAIILGCTELPLAINENNSPVDCLDIMEIHIQKLVELI